MRPPQTLHEIFQISNNNRKKNKQRKKSKLESCQLSGTASTNPLFSGWESQQNLDAASGYGAAPPPTNVHQIIQF